MNVLAPAASAHLERRLEAVLTPMERLRIGLDLGGTLLAAGLLIVAFLLQWFDTHAQEPLIELFKCTAALIVAIPVFAVALRGLWTGNPDDIIEQLVAVAVLAALASGEFETAAFVPMILNLGHFLEQRSILGAQAAIDGLKNLYGRSATLLTSSGETEVEPSALRLNDVVLVRPGELVPADCTVSKGVSTVDQSSITGESLAEEVVPGMRLFAGSVNLTGRLEVKVTGVGDQTALGRVLELLRSAEQSKTPAVRLIERYAGYYVPIMLMTSAVLLFLTRDMSRVVTLMVVACPGTFILAGPTAMIAALAAASRLGILIKNSKFLEVLADVDTVVLDKTGTVTLGHLEVVEVRPFDDASDEDLIRTAAICAQGSRHPVSRAVVRLAANRGIASVAAPERIAETPGRGVSAVTECGTCVLGRGDWLREQGLHVPETSDHDGAVVWIARGDKVLGCLTMADLPRPEAGQAINELRALGLSRIVLLTGDRWKAARDVAAALNIENVIAEVLPEQKLQVVQSEKANRRVIMVVGDGVNDALALASGDVGVAMGAMGSDVALKSADVALMANDLNRLPLAIRLSRRTRSTINQNLLIGAGSSVLMLSLAAMGLISPIVGAVLHNAGEIYVLANIARLLSFDKTTV